MGGIQGFPADVVGPGGFLGHTDSVQGRHHVGSEDPPGPGIPGPDPCPSGKG